jgi:colanic acid/amylovoran biosynthesis protein
MDKLKIGILHAPNTLNYGSMMLCENAIYYLSKIVHNIFFVVLSNFVEETESRLRNAIERDNIEVRPHTASSRIKTISNRLSFPLDKLVFRYKNLIKQLNDCSVIIVLGGDDISEYYGILKLLDMLLRLQYLKKADKKIYLLGQSIGPMYSWRIGLTRKVLGRIDKIYHRGFRSYHYVTDVLGVKHNSFFSSDLAFLDLPRQNEVFDIEKYDIEPQKYITFVPSGFWSGYCDNYGVYLEGLVAVTKYMVSKCEAFDMRMVLLPHVLRWTYDRELVKEMITRIGNDRIVPINDILLPFQARAILGSSYFVVTQRMHGAISSLQKGVPALSLSYSVKFSEVIKNYLGLPELVVEVRKANFREDVDRAYSAIDFALENITPLKGKIEKAVNQAKIDAMVQIEDLAKDMLN